MLPTGRGRAAPDGPDEAPPTSSRSRHAMHQRSPSHPFKRLPQLARGSLAAPALLLAAALALAAPGGAAAHALIPAHAKLTHADPAPGAVLKDAPSTITLQ